MPITLNEEQVRLLAEALVGNQVKPKRPTRRRRAIDKPTQQLVSLAQQAELAKLLAKEPPRPVTLAVRCDLESKQWVLCDAVTGEPMAYLDNQSQGVVLIRTQFKCRYDPNLQIGCGATGYHAWVVGERHSTAPIQVGEQRLIKLNYNPLDGKFWIDGASLNYDLRYQFAYVDNIENLILSRNCQAYMLLAEVKTKALKWELPF